MGKLLDGCGKKLKSVSVGKLDSAATAYFTKLRNIQNCSIFGFKNSIVVNGTILYSHSYLDKADEKICGLDKCDLTGTLFVTPTDSGDDSDSESTSDSISDSVSDSDSISDSESTSESVSDSDSTSESASESENTKPMESILADGTSATTVTTQLKVVGEDYQFGYLSVMIYGAAGDAFTLTVKNQTGDGANQYNVALKNTGWNVVTIELFNPDTVVSTGWIATDDNFLLVIEAKQKTEFRVSTIILSKDSYDLVRDQSIAFNCISEFSGDIALSITEDTCDIPTYDDTATKLERKLSATKVTGKLIEFFGVSKRKQESEFQVTVSDEFAATKTTVDGVDYSVVTIPDLAEGDCPNLIVQPQNCEYEVLDHLSIDGSSSAVNLADDQFFIVDNKIYMSAAYAGMKVIVAYPKTAEGEGWDLTSDNLNDQKYHMEIVVPYGNDEYLIKSDNVMITSLPLEWKKEAGTFDISYTMAKNSDGKFAEIIKLSNRK